MVLTISGKIDNFAIITPKSVKLEGTADQEIKRIVKIIPEKKHPFKILGTRLERKEENIRFELEEVKKGKGLEYLLTIENLKKEKGRYFNSVNLKTDSKIQPEIKIRVYGNISEPIQEKKEAIH